MSITVTCPPDHKHESTCYVTHKCRCERCRAHNRAREVRRRKLKAYGRWSWDENLVDIRPVRDHIRTLQAFGIGPVTIGRLAHVQPRKINDILNGEHNHGDGVMVRLNRVARGPAERIMAVEPILENAPDGAHVKAYPYVRMARALYAAGWSQSAIARAIDVNPVNFDLVKRSPKRITAATARRVVAAYDRMCMQTPPETTGRERAVAARCRRQARAHGWPMPMDWEAGDFHATASIRRSAA